MEFINEENLLGGIIVASFLMGIIACRFTTRLFEVSHAARIVQSTIYSCLMMCAKIHEDMAFLMELKHKYMRESGMTSGEVFSFCEVDKKTINNWKESVVQRMILLAPPSFSFMIKFSNWREAMQQLKDMYDNKE